MAQSTLQVTNQNVTLPSGIKVFYRAAGSPSAPPLVLMHGFPSSSHQYRRLIPLLAHLTGHYIVAPDFPGYGFTTVPDSLNYTYNFANLTDTFTSFLSVLGINKFAAYIFDYGAPILFRYALDHPDAVTALITQNGNAYEEGFGADFWAPIKKYWASPDSTEAKNNLASMATYEVTKSQYINGTPSSHLNNIAPETYTLDQALMERPGNATIQLELLLNYASNVDLYPKFQTWLRDSKVPVLAVWGKNDVIFVPEGAQAFKRDVTGKFELRFLDAGHFAVESHYSEIADAIVGFLKDVEA
ncbi:MAG: hypothetical protein M1812_006785 [Candelaria pacifica]|nr:MAG: hypothetical protein M1812_006785 [Candelaria pacifica]